MDDKRIDPIWELMTQLHQTLQAAKPTERNEIARRYAVTVTELEKIMAYYDLWVYRGLKAAEGE
jgi:hypothetical protein